MVRTPVLPLLVALTAGVVFAQEPVHESIVVTGVAQPVPLQEADRDVSVLVLPKNERALYDSWFSLLELDAALDLAQRAPGGFLGDLSIRGATFGQTLVLLNGFRISDSQTGHFNLDVPVPVDAITDVEVLKGSGSTLYGSDAIGGVVNVRTEPQATPDLRILSGFGNFGTNQQHVVAAFGSPKLSEDLEAARDFSTGFAPDRDYRNLALSSLTSATTALGAGSLLLAYSDRPYGADQFYGPYPSWERIRTWFGSAHQNFGKKTEANVAYRRHTDLFVLFRDNPQIYTNRHIEDTWQASMRRHDELPKHAVLSYGGEMLSESINSTNLGMRHRVRGSGYAVYDVRFKGRFSFSAGLREEVFGSGQVATSPSASGAVWLNARVKLRASVSRAFRLPSFTDLYYSDPANQGNPNLKPESATSYEGGADLYLTKKLRGAVNVFQRRDSNEIDYVKAPGASIWQATNFDRLHFTGVEALLEYTPVAGQTIGVAFTALHGISANEGLLQSKYAFNYPVHSAVLQWRGSIKRVAVKTRVGIVDRFNRDPYAVWDASAAYAYGRVRPFLQLTNLTNTLYQEIPGVTMPSRGVLGGVELVLREAK